MCTIKAPCRIADLDTALRIYYAYPELQNPQLCELFGRQLGSSTLSKYKKIIRDRQRQLDIKTSMPHAVNTAVAYEVFGIDVEDLEKRRTKLKKLGLTG